MKAVGRGRGRLQTVSYWAELTITGLARLSKEHLRLGLGCAKQTPDNRELPRDLPASRSWLAACTHTCRSLQATTTGDT